MIRSTIIPIILSICFCLILCTCNNSKRKDSNVATAEAKTALLIARSIEATGSLVPSSNLNELFYQRYRVPSNLQSVFATMYERLRADIELVQHHHKSRVSVRYFLLNRYLLHSEVSLEKLGEIRYSASAANPVYMAFALQSENMLDWNCIGSPNYIKTLARSFGVSEKEATEGVWVLLRNPPDAIYEAVALMIKANIEDADIQHPDFMFQNVIVPYLTYVSKGYRIQGAIEDSVFSSFKITFGAQRTANELRDFSNAFKQYMAGNTINVKYINALNSLLGSSGFRLHVRNRTCIGYRILKEQIPIARDGIGNVVFLKKISVCLSMAFLGLSTINEKDVIITIDDISDYAEDIMYDLSHGKCSVSLQSRFAATWMGCNVGLNIESADGILFSLLQREFGHLSQMEIVNRLIKQIAVHEVKHKWDEMTNANKDWYNVDAETSAHLTETLYSGIPLYSLISLIHRYHGFYANIPRDDIRQKLRTYLKRYWTLAQALSTDTMNIDQFRKKISTLYAEYTAIDGGLLPPEQKFYQEIFKPCFENIPEFSLEDLRVN